MKKLLFVAATAAVAAAIPGAASAAVCTADNLTCTFEPGDAEFAVSGDTTPPITGVVSASIGRTAIPAGTFTDTYFFIVDADGLGSGSISTSLSGPSTDINFTSVTINGLVVPRSPNGAVEFAGISGVPVLNGAENRLVVVGTSAGEGSYGGNLTFTPNSAVPEPATWAMMLMGFGAIGFGMRRRRKETARVRFAF
jgi:hypothetical protein